MPRQARRLKAKASPAAPQPAQSGGQVSQAFITATGSRLARTS
jgi:hypothetical protein